MNNHRKYKKKKPILTEFSTFEPVQDDEQLATQNLFNISNSWDDPREINPHSEVQMFTSADSEQITYSKTDKIPTKTQYSQFSSKKNNQYQPKQIQKIMDKQFISESKNLLKLYSAPDNQSVLNQSNSVKSKIQNFAEKDEKTTKKPVLKSYCNSFKSDSVFVVKRRVSPEKTQIQKSKKRLQELKSTRNEHKQHGSLQKNHQMFINTKKSGYFSPHRNYFHSNKKKTPDNKSLSEVKHKPTEYDNFEDFRSLNRMKWMLLKSNMDNNQESIRLTPDKQIRNFSLTAQIFYNPHNKPEEKQKNNSFRKRLSFFKNQKTKKQMKLTM